MKKEDNDHNIFRDVVALIGVLCYILAWIGFMVVVKLGI
jgi:hypothetical protein